MPVKNSEKLRETLIKLLNEREVIKHGKFILSSGRRAITMLISRGRSRTLRFSG